MDSTINLLPEKDKQLKREGQRKPSTEMIEMSKPQDRVFQERVVRMEGLLAFFKRIFRRAPELPKPKTVVAPLPVPPKPVPAAQKPAAPVTKLETMMDRLPGAPKPPAPPPTGNFFTKLFSTSGKAAPTVPSRPPLLVPKPPPPSAKAAAPTPPPVRHVASWAPPPPSKHDVLPPPPSGRTFVPPAPLPPPPSAPRPVAPASQATEAQPLLGNSLNVNLVPEQYQPEASVRDRVFAASLVGGAVLLVVVAALGLYFYQQRLETKVASIDQQILLVNQEVTSRERDDMNDAIILQQRTGDVKRVLDQHVYWDVFFQKLEGVTLPTVAYTTMSVDVAGSVTLMAQAKTYDDVGAQLLTYQQAKDFITEVNISAATKVSSSPATSRTGTPPGQTAQPPQSLVTFSVSMRVNPALFYHR